MCRENLIDFDSYIIYENGTIFSKSWNREKKPQETDDGYLRLSLKCNDGKNRSFLLHRVIYYFFKGEIPEEMRVNHIDEYKKNNIIGNLNLLTHKDNCNWGTRNERISEKHKGVRKGSPSDETREHISIAQKKRFETENVWNKGIKNCFSEDTIKKMRDSHKKRSVLQLDNEGNEVGLFYSLMEAKRKLGIDASSIMRCCKGKQKTAGGYKWKYNSI